MKPTTKLQKRAFGLSNGLSKLTDKQREWAFLHSFKHLGYRLKKVTTCLECRYSFQTRVKKCNCPKCGMELTIIDTQKRKLDTEGYFCVLDTKEDFRVIRFFEVWQNCRVGNEVEYKIKEVTQNWILPSGDHTVISRLNGGSFFMEITGMES